MGDCEWVNCCFKKNIRNLELTYYQRKVCFLNNMMYSDNCFVDHITALYLHSNEYKLLCNLALVSPYASKYNIRHHSGEKFYDACFVVFVAVACLLVYCCYAKSTGSATVAYELAFFFFYFIDLHFVCKINSYYA